MMLISHFALSLRPPRNRLPARLQPIALGVLLGVGFLPDALPAATLYENAFTTAEAGTTLPDDLQVMGGDFVIGTESGNTFLELPGAPLDTFGLLFGPRKQDHIEVLARIHGTNQKRRYPAFAVGLGSVGGFRLQVSPAKRRIEIIKGDAVLATSSYTWKPDTWTWLRLQLLKTGDSEWTVRGRVWQDGEEEPNAWMLTHKSDQEPYGGRASIWGKPYAGTPIRFDDLKVSEPAP